MSTQKQPKDNVPDDPTFKETVMRDELTPENEEIKDQFKNMLPEVELEFKELASKSASGAAASAKGPVIKVKDF